MGHSAQIQSVLEAACHPEFAERYQQIQRTGGCSDPIRHEGGSTMIRVSTGEVVHSYSSASEPGGQVLVPCKNRRKSRCRACAEIYRSDAFQLLKAGLVGGKGVPETVATHPVVMATFTATPFGRSHHRVLAKDGTTVLRCHPHGEHRCRKRHRADDPALGTPLDPDSYDYAGAMIWNAMASVLWAKTMDRLTKELAARAGCSQRRFRLVGAKSFAKVGETQKRGLYHFHAVIRVDGVDPEDRMAIVRPGPWATLEALTEAIEAAVARVMVVAPGGRHIRWGDQLDVHPIVAFPPGQEITEAGVEGYLSKDAAGRIAEYSTKAAESSGTVDRPIWCSKCQGTGRVDASAERTTLDVDTGEIGSAPHGEGCQLPVAGVERECQRCGGSGLRQAIASLKVSEHARRMIQTCWDLGGDPLYAQLKLRRWAHMLGYGGHFLSKSRRYSTTFGALRQVRRDFCTAHTLARAGLPRATPVVRMAADRSVEGVDMPTEGVEGDPVVVVGAWRYHSRGHSPGEGLWAASVAERIAESRRLAREARWDQAEDDENWEAA
jgi:hypothetical protein